MPSLLLLPMNMAMTPNQQIAVMVFGGLIVVASLLLLFLKKEGGQNRIKLGGQEFEISTPSLVVFLAGCAIFVLPLFLPVQQQKPDFLPVQQQKPEGNRLVNLNVRCLDVEAAGTSDGANVQQWTCHEGLHQRWKIRPFDNAYEIVNVNSGKCLDVENANTSDGAKVQQWTCLGGLNQRWETRVSGPGFKTVNLNSGKCLAVDKASTSDGAKVQQWTCPEESHVENNKLWKFQ